MFQGAHKFNQDIGEWNTLKVNTIREMFIDAAKFNQDITAWKVTVTCDTFNMFLNATDMVTNYSALTGFSSSGDVLNSFFNADASVAAAANIAKAAVAQTTTLVADLADGDAQAIIAIATKLNEKTQTFRAPLETFTSSTELEAKGKTQTARRSISTTQKAALSSIKTIFMNSTLTDDAAVVLQKKTVISSMKTALDLIISSSGVDSIELDASELVLNGTYADGEKIVVGRPNSTVSDPPGAKVPSNFYSTLSKPGDWVIRRYNADVVPGKGAFEVKILYVKDVSAGAKHSIEISGDDFTNGDKAGADVADLDRLFPGDRVNFMSTESHVYIIIGSAESGTDGSTICFLGDTKVKTDQGLIRFDKLTLGNTVNNYKIRYITKVKNADDHMIFIKKHALGENIPNEDTYISRNHGIIMDNHLVRAKLLVNGTTIIKAYRDADVIYNILTEEHTIIYVNNMPCETLNPKDPKVKKYIK